MRGISASLLVTAGLACLLAVAPAMGAGNKKGAAKKGGEEGQGKIFDRFDPDGDGKVAIKDLPEQARQRVAILDRDGDGIISRAEFDAVAGGANGPAKANKGKGKGKRPGLGGKGGAEEIFKKLDTDGDGKLTGNEIPERMKKDLKRIDKNGDGTVTKEELIAAGPPPGGPGGGDGDRAEMLRKRLQALDKDGDGKVAIADMPEFAQAHAKKADKNGDGQLDKEEMDGLAKSMPAGFGGGDAAAKAKQAFNDQDSDADGRVTKSEAKGELASDFDAIDANKDGKIDLQEAENFASAKAEKSDEGAARKAERKAEKKGKKSA